MFVHKIDGKEQIKQTANFFWKKERRVCVASSTPKSEHYKNKLAVRIFEELQKFFFDKIQSTWTWWPQKR